MAVTVRSCSYAFTYDVFLSFKGEDTRHSFTGNLYKHLHDRGIHTFIDDVELQRGEEIKPSLLKAIEESRIAIPVLSNNYASSAFCLDELTTILHCAERKGGLVLPVFYKVSPSEVRHQSGSYGEALARHEERFKAEKEKFNHNMERLEKWKMALHRVANCCGYHLRGDEYEHEFIGNIVELVSSKIDRAPLPVADYPVGLESRVLEIRKLLDVGSHDGVHMIGIHGIGGVGKSTLARAVYNLIADDFDGSCFLENVREKSRKHGLQHLQSILLLEILGEKKIKLTSVEQRTSMIQRRLQRKKVLLVLDDVDEYKQLQTIVGRPDWFDMQETVQWNKNAFKKMKNLKTLIIKNVHLSESPKYLPNSLRVLEWWSYPSQCLPSDFHPRKLVICKLPDSCFTSPQLDGLLKKFVNVRVLNFDDCLCLTHIPDISGLPSLENLSFKYCERLLTVHGSIGLLDKLKILSAFGCKNLTSFPPLKLISLEKLELSYCSSLERFPEIIGKMQSIREVWLHGTPIKELPFSFRNLIGLRELYLLDCEVVHLPSSIITMPELTLIHASGWKGWQWLKQEEGEEKVVGSIVSSKVECLYALECNLHDDFFSIDFTWFAYVKKLYLWGNNFTILPECIKECQFLCDIEVRNCKQLREIRGIPPKLKYFNATNCESLSSSSTSMLLNQDLHEAGNTLFYLPGVRIPEWFNHQSRGRSISFWFRNKFPDKVLCLVIAPMDNDSGWLSPRVLINGNKCSVDSLNFLMGKDHTYVFDLKKIQLKNMYEGPFENEWNHAQITCEGWSWKETSIPIKIGIHLFNQESSMKDIRQWPQQFGITKPPVLLKRHRFVDMEVS
ncbi:hypothetical protein Fmac_028099 [Flemingia macrophylla]|uniref:ADP-ribosyl cyclase/cyclic ADP-ribose hydrolase n=1 Tax=Flemingia macrophylla TaxID=520843 RepID=A0ABD1LLB5_9FABA